MVKHILGEYSGLNISEQDCIVEHVNKLDNPTYVEIGVLIGGNLVNVLRKCKNVYCIGVDLFEDFSVNELNTHAYTHLKTKQPIMKNVDFCVKNELEEKIKSFGYDNFELRKGDSAKVLTTLDKIENGVIFIDGNHTYKACLTDYKNSLKILKHGYIILHDIDWDGPSQVFNECLFNKRSISRCGIITIN